MAQNRPTPEAAAVMLGRPVAHGIRWRRRRWVTGEKGMPESRELAAIGFIGYTRPEVVEAFATGLRAAGLPD